MRSKLLIFLTFLLFIFIFLKSVLLQLLRGTLNNLRILIYNLSGEWYSLNPTSVDKLNPKESITFFVTYYPTLAGNYKFRINVTSKETSLTFDSLLMAAELRPEEKEEIKEKKEEAKAFWEIYSSYLIIFGIIAPSIIAIYMIFFLTAKRCPLYGGKNEIGI